MTSTTEITKVLVDATVEADMGVDTYKFHGETQEDYSRRLARTLNSEIAAFHKHCRDHRSLDHIRLSVRHTYEYHCPCGAEYDTEQDAKNCLADHTESV